MFVLTQFKITKRQRQWVLMDAHTCLPLWYPLQYFVNHLASRSSATQSASLQVLKLFYEFWYQKHGVTFCYSFYSLGHNPMIAIEELTSFFHYLETGHSCVSFSLPKNALKAKVFVYHQLQVLPITSSVPTRLGLRLRASPAKSSSNCRRIVFFCFSSPRRSVLNEISWNK